MEFHNWNKSAPLDFIAFGPFDVIFGSPYF